ncbi:MAG: hypothetical protein ACFCGT_10645 [Sandaracinaceae bacterium]
MEQFGKALALIAQASGAVYFAGGALASAGACHGTGLLLFGISLAFAAGAVGLARGASWAPGFGAGLSVFTAAALLPAVLVPAVAAMVTVLCLGLTGLGLRGMATARTLGERPAEWRLTALSLSAGMATPCLLIFGLSPLTSGFGAAVSTAVAALALTGVAVAFRGRTWGLFAMAAALPFLAMDLGAPSLHPYAAWKHQAAGDAAGVLLLFALVPFVMPALRFLRDGARR